MLYVILFVVGMVFGTFTLYLSYCAIWEAKRTGKLALTPLPVKVVVYLILGCLVVLDILFNFTVGSAIFLQPPNFRRPLFTQRCSKNLDLMDWRGRRARFICDGWLNPFQAGHCH